MDYTNEQKEGLRRLSFDNVRKVLCDKGYMRSKPTGRIQNAIDVVMFEFGMKFPQAVDTLAKYFPEALAAGKDIGVTSFKQAMIAAKEKAENSGRSFKEYPNFNIITDIRKASVKWWKALQLESIHIKTVIPQCLKSPNLFPYEKKNADLSDLLWAVPVLFHLSRAGTAENPVNLFCTPHWKENKIGIMVNDIQDDLLRMFPASAVIKTSRRKCQAFYILEKKEDKEFYNFVTKRLNEMYGDAEICYVNHDTRLPGFYNNGEYDPETKGDEMCFRCTVSDSTADSPKSLLEFIYDELKVEWDQILEKRMWSERTNRALDRTGLACGASAVPDGVATMVEYIEKLERCDWPEWVLERGEFAKDFFIKRMSEDGKVNKSRVDASVARYLHSIGATGSEIYSYLLDHSCQYEGFGGNDWISKRNSSARKTTANMAPACFVSDGWVARHPESVFNWEKRYPELFEDLPQKAKERLKCNDVTRTAKDNCGRKTEPVAEPVFVDLELDEFGLAANDLW